MQGIVQSWSAEQRPRIPVPPSRWKWTSKANNVKVLVCHFPGHLPARQPLAITAHNNTFRSDCVHAWSVVRFYLPSCGEISAQRISESGVRNFCPALGGKKGAKRHLGAWKLPAALKCDDRSLIFYASGCNWIKTKPGWRNEWLPVWPNLSPFFALRRSSSLRWLQRLAKSFVADS